MNEQERLNQANLLLVKLGELNNLLLAWNISVQQESI